MRLLKFGRRPEVTGIGLAIKTLLDLRPPNTVRSYRGCLADFARFLKVDVNSYNFEIRLRDVDAKTALFYFQELRQRQLSDATIRQRFEILRYIFGHLKQIGLLAENPFANLKRTVIGHKQVQKRPTKLLAFSQVEEILRKPAYTKEAIRDRALLAVLFGGALRRSEARALNIKDVVWHEGGAYLRLMNTKSGRIQDQAIAEFAFEPLDDLIAQRMAEGAVIHDPLFPFYYKSGQPGKRVSESDCYRTYKRNLGAAPHSARATAITKLLSDGVPMNVVKDFSRHASYQMVEVYDKRVKGIQNSAAKLLKF